MAFSSIFRKKLAEKFGDNQKSSIFASVFAYIWANGGCREIVPQLSVFMISTLCLNIYFFCFIGVMFYPIR